MSRAIRPALIAVIFALCWSALVVPPFVAVTPTIDLSWAGALSYFAARDLRFGHDVIFTYGPLGYLISGVYSGEMYRAQVSWALISAAIYALIFTRAVLRLPTLWRTPFVLLLLIFFQGQDWIYMLVCAALAAELLGNKSARRGSTLFAAVVLGVTSLLKFNFFLTAIVVAVLVTARQLEQRRFLSAALMPLTYAITVLITWGIAGQQLGDLWPYLRYSLEITSGYKDAMAFPASSNAVVILGVVVALLALALCCVFIMQRLFAPAFFVFAIYIAWNHGFVRADDHVLGFFMLVPLLAILLWSAAVPRKKVAAHALTIAIFAASLAGITTQQSGLLGARFGQTTARMTGAWRALVSPGVLEHRLASDFAREKTQAALPRVSAEVGAAPIDVFGYEQGIALLNELNYTPRPVFQSYSVHTSALIDANAEFYRSARAPTYVLLKLQTIDWRLPVLDDAGALREILLRYDFLFEENGYALWKKRSDLPAQTSFEPLASRKTHFGSSVRVPDAPPLMWMELDFRCSWLGWFRRAFYKLPDVYIRLKDKNGGESRHRVIPAMTTRGSLISPKVETNADLVSLTTGGELLGIESFSIEIAEADRRYFRDSIRVRFSSVQSFAR